MWYLSLCGWLILLYMMNTLPNRFVWMTESHFFLWLPCTDTTCTSLILQLWTCQILPELDCLNSSVRKMGVHFREFNSVSFPLTIYPILEMLLKQCLFFQYLRNLYKSCTNLYPIKICGNFLSSISSLALVVLFIITALTNMVIHECSIDLHFLDNCKLNWPSLH